MSIGAAAGMASIRTRRSKRPAVVATAASSSASSSAHRRAAPAVSAKSVRTSVAEWRDDKSSTECEGCAKRFHFLRRRRHHCRRCGGLFCASCSRGESVLRELGLGNVAVRVCDGCERAGQTSSAFRQLRLPAPAPGGGLPGTASPPPPLEVLRRSSSLYRQTLASSASSSSLPGLSIVSSSPSVQHNTSMHAALPSVMVFDAMQARSRVLTTVSPPSPPAVSPTRTALVLPSS